MKIFYIFCLTATFLSLSLYAQDIDHWETLIREGDSWKYLVPSAEPDAAWKDPGFDDTSWSSGDSGFGYGDEDDNTIVPTTLSVYIRKVFNIVDLGVIEEMILHMDYDDSFVAYINGTEIARSFISGDPPRFDQPSDGLHEALLYQGIPPESFPVDMNLLNQGENVIAIQVHNQSLTSSDMTAIPVLLAGINNTSNDYFPLPWWFQPPLEFTSSDLPVISIDTRGQAIMNDPKIMADIGIIYNGEGVRNSVFDPFNEYEGVCGIEFRGESSLGFPKKSYGIEMWDSNGNDIDTSFLNFPSEEDFVLHGPYSDKSLLNNVLAMKLGNDLGQYASRTRLVELLINEEYQGVYVVMERIKRDNDRVDIANLRPEDVEGDQLTGGYIIRIDKGEDDGWESEYYAYGSDYKIFFQYYYPDEFDIQPRQKEYIRNFMNEFENAIFSSNYKNSTGRHYLEYIDLRTFVDNWILNELSKNVDAYRLSTYFYKDRDSRGGRLKAGPLWDYNLAFGNGDYCGGDDITGWEYYQCVGTSPFWWHRMLEDEVFTNALRCRWEELRQTKLHTDTINAYLDSMRDLLSEAQERNFQRWPILGTYVWPNSWFYTESTSHGEIIENMKNWIEDRSLWLDDNFPGEAVDCALYEPPYSGLITGFEGYNGESHNIRVYPNPVQDALYIESDRSIREVVITTLTGQILIKKTFQSGDISMDLKTNLKSGVYLLLIVTEDARKVRKIFVE